MKKILAIAWLTWKAALRFRLFLVIAVLLLLAVVGLPLLVKSDGTARGFAQILITYTLSAIATLLGFSTLWLSCGTLARDVEECQIQVVATKPVARWQIWLGKWLGVVSLNAVLLVLSGASVYGLLQWRAARLPTAEQKILRTQVLVARGEVKAPDFQARISTQTEELLRKRLKQAQVANANLSEVRQQIRSQVVANYEVVPPGYSREWKVDLGLAAKFLRNQPLQLRVKFNAAQKSPSGTFIGQWRVGPLESANAWYSGPMSLAPNTYHEISIPPNLFDNQGVLTIAFVNHNDTTLLFPLKDGIAVLYPQGSFTLNFARGLGIILCWMALLAALGLLAASFLSFPVAAFFSLALLIVVLSSGVMAEVVSTGSILGSNSRPTPLQHFFTSGVAIPIYQGMLTVINLAKNFSPIAALSSGRSISWSDLGLAFVQIVLLLGGILAAIGIFLFSRRELATAQGNG